MDKEDRSGVCGFLAGRGFLSHPPQAREPLPSEAWLGVAHGGWLSDLKGQHKNPTRAVGVHWADGEMAAALVSRTSGSQFSNILAEPSSSNPHLQPERPGMTQGLYTQLTPVTLGGARDDSRLQFPGDSSPTAGGGASQSPPPPASARARTDSLPRPGPH